MKRTTISVIVLLFGTFQAGAAPDYDDISRILTKYCAGCHNETDSNGDFALDTYANLAKGGESGPAMTSGSSASSRMIQMLLGRVEPTMPPEDEPRPSDAEIQQLVDWIDAGAQAPPSEKNGEKRNQPYRLQTPQIAPSQDVQQPITAIGYSPDGKSLAVARFQTIELWSVERDDRRQIGALPDHPGKINSVAFTTDGRYLLAGTGISGFEGEAVLWRIADRKVVRRYGRHRDILYAAAISPDGRMVATAGYDKRIQISDFDTGERLQEIQGHNGAIYDLAFGPLSKRISTASADATIKVWHVPDGKRLDTRSEPLKEQYATAISGDGNLLAGGGADSRLRIWELVSRDVEGINPLRFARFAHEGAIENVCFSQSGSFIVSVGRDALIKVWATNDMRLIASLPKQPTEIAAISVAPSDDAIAVGRMDGTFDVYPLNLRAPNSPTPEFRTGVAVASASDDVEVLHEVEKEPNDTAGESQSISAPFEVTGRIHDSESGVDVDLFRFHSKRDESWIISVRANRDRSKLDSKVEVLDASGQPIPRVLLQAVRDSYFTFRGKDSLGTGDFRLHNWEEMSLDQLLYCNGEVVKLFHYPRGPDSGFNVYPNFGNRHTFFDTPALAHALHEPCYIVEPHLPGTDLAANGLPEFTVYYENDDDAQRELGSDSRLSFIAPRDGEFLVRLSDVRDFQGPDYHYKLSVRTAKPRFEIRKIHGENPKVARGSGRKFGIEIDRIDNFDGPVEIHIDNLPSGLTVPGPISIQAGHLRTWARLEASVDTPDLTEESSKQIIVRATAKIDDEIVTRTRSLGEVKLSEPPKLYVHLLPDDEMRTPVNVAAGMPMITISAGGTTTARIQVERHGYEGRINFGKEEAALNLPHGVYVDNTGLNGVLIPEDEQERVFFITAEPWVQPQDRVIFVEASEAGRPTSNAAMLRVVHGRE